MRIKAQIRHVGLFVLIALSGVFLLYTSQAVQKSQRELRVAKAAVQKEVDTLHMLRAEWAFLSAPSRLEVIAQENLGMKQSDDGGLVSSVRAVKQKQDQGQPHMRGASYR